MIARSNLLNSIWILNFSNNLIDLTLGIGFGVLRHGKKLREFVLSCQLRNTEIPTKVTITTAMTFRSTWSLPVELPEKPNSKRDFAVCVSVCYGKEWDVYKIVEWMELLKILGVSRVGIYNNTLGAEEARVFQYYDSQGFVDFRQSWNFISDPGVLTSHLHWSPVINVLCNAVACPHLERSGMGTACSRSASAHLYHAGSRLLPCDGAAD